MTRKTNPRSNLIVGLITIVALNIAAASYLLNLYKFAICTSDSQCTSTAYRGLAIPVFPLGIAIGFSTLDGDSKKWWVIQKYVNTHFTNQEDSLTLPMLELHVVIIGFTTGETNWKY